MKNMIERRIPRPMMMARRAHHESMKKLLIVLLLFLFITLAGCDVPTDPAAALLAKLVAYEMRFVTIGGLEPVLTEEPRFGPHPTPHAVGQIEIDRDEFPEPTVLTTPYEQDFAMNMAVAIHEARIVFEQCVGLIPGEYCLTSTDQFDYSLKIEGEGDRLSVDLYRSESGITMEGAFLGVYAEIMEFDLIDDKVLFDYVRENMTQNGGDETHDLYYDRFDESGDTISIGLDLTDETYLEYLIHDRGTGGWFSLYDDATESSVTRLDMTTDRFVSETFYPDGSTNMTIVYDNERRSLTYHAWEAHGVPRASLKWNLLDVEGWDRAVYHTYADDEVYQGETRVLETFTVYVAPEEVYPVAQATYEFSPESLTAGLVDLTLVGLHFDAIPFDRLSTDLGRLAEDRLAALAAYGLSADMAENRAALLAMVPYRADLPMMQELFD